MQKSAEGIVGRPPFEEGRPKARTVPDEIRRLMTTTRSPRQLELALPMPSRGEAMRRDTQEIETVTAMAERESPASTAHLMEAICAPDNIGAALRAVVRNKHPTKAPRTSCARRDNLSWAFTHGLDPWGAARGEPLSPGYAVGCH